MSCRGSFRAFYKLRLIDCITNSYKKFFSCSSEFPSEISQMIPSENLSYVHTEILPWASIEESSIDSSGKSPKDSSSN